VRAAVLAGALAGGVALSQFPEFSQQYLQRLAGRVDALGQVVADFDRSAQATGQTRDEALAEFRGTPFLERRRVDMTATFVAYDRLSADLADLRAASALGRLAEVWRLRDRRTLEGAWSDFRPAVPVTADGIACAALGAAVGGGAMLGLMGLVRLPRGRRRA
jgi:hypothetical protein